jgi:hypothetical protein
MSAQNQTTNGSDETTGNPVSLASGTRGSEFESHRPDQLLLVFLQISLFS